MLLLAGNVEALAGGSNDGETIAGTGFHVEPAAHASAGDAADMEFQGGFTGEAGDGVTAGESGGGVESDVLSGAELDGLVRLEADAEDIGAEEFKVDDGGSGLGIGSGGGDSEVLGGLADAGQEVASGLQGRLESRLSGRRDWTIDSAVETGAARAGLAGMWRLHAGAEQSVENGFILNERDLKVAVSYNRHRRELAVQNVGAGGFSDGGNLGNQRLRNAQFGEGLAEEFNDGIDVRIIESTADETGVAGAHILAAVVGGSAEDHGEEGFLLADLLIHIDVIEEMGDAIVGEDLAVEDIDRSVDGGSSA